MKAFLAAAVATVVIAIGAWAAFGTVNTSVDEVSSSSSVRL
jgi:Ni,Fe-hydrogenase I small subunit